VNAFVEATPISGPASVGKVDVGFARDRRFAHVDDGADRHALLAAIAQRRQRVGGFARLRDEQRGRVLGQRHLAVAELGGDVDVDRQARVALEPVLCRPGRRDRPCRRPRSPGGRDGGEVERQIENPRRRFGEVDIVRERVRDHLRLLVDLLLHEVAVVALVDEEARSDRLLTLPLHRVAAHVVDLRLVAAHDAQSPSSR
jgi:hypothetical protein